MRIQSVETSGIKLFGERTLDFRDRNRRAAQLVVVVGGPGTGKTYLLELIAAAKEAIAPYGPMPDDKRFLAAADAPGKVALSWWLSDDEAGDMDTTEALRVTETMWGGVLSLVAENDADMLRLLARHDESSPTGKLVYYQATRTLPIGAAGSGRHVRLALTNDNAKFDGLDAYVADLCLDGVARLAKDEASPHLARFISLFSSLCGSVTLNGLVRTRSGIQPSFLRGDTEIPLVDLSHSEREAFLLSASLCRSMVSSSIVLLDEPELRCAPSQLLGRLRALLAFDPTNQFIVATRHRALATELAGEAAIVDLGGAF